MEEVVASLATKSFKCIILQSNHGGAQPLLKDVWAGSILVDTSRGQ